MAIHYRSHRDPKSSHQQISQLVRQLGQSPVLDVGAAQGMLGNSLAGHRHRAGRRRGQSGMGGDGQAALPKRARLLYSGRAAAARRRIRPSSAPTCWNTRLIRWRVLRQLRRAAADDATFIVSVPNIAHLAVRLMLLFGHFPKMERGPLDRTHLQFLTKDTARHMMEAAGLRVQRYFVTGVPLDELWKAGEGNLLFNG